MTKLLFIIGIRRSGTSILRDLIDKHPEVAGIEFEPHPLWAAIDTSHFNRFKSGAYGNYSQVCHRIIHTFRNNGKYERYYGAKFALNPGVKALEWVWLKRTYGEAKFIFIVRSNMSTWNSYVKQDKDSVRGLITKAAYMAECENIKQTFKDQGIVISYENLRLNADKALKPMWSYLGLTALNGMDKYMKAPEF